jgi:hypothetical protein
MVGSGRSLPAMSLLERVRKSLADRKRDRDEELDEQLDAERRGEASDLRSHKRNAADRYASEEFPSAGAGFIPPP